WHREDDSFAVAIGQAIPSGKYKAAAAPGANNELHLEAYYRLQINEHIALSPDVQVIWNPFGGLAPRNRGVVTAFGLRTQIDL
nr:carbohydrate porin [bacterium]